MAIALSASVGLGGQNRPSDVKTIQVNLNRVPVSRGGPTPPLNPDAKIGPLTTGAIARFQKNYFGWGDGLITPGAQTHRQLETVINSLPSTPDIGLGGAGPATPDVWPNSGSQSDMIERVLSNLPKTESLANARDWLEQLSPARLTIIDVALQEATPRPGRVSDMEGHTSLQIDPWDGTRKRMRNGWRRLHEYFQSASVAVDMNIPAEREGILCWNKRVQKNHLPQAPGTTPGIHWCGIFATWVCRTAQMRWPNFHHRPLRWMSPLISMPSLTALQNGGKLDVRPGDIAVILKNTHHFVVISPPVGDPKNPAVWAVSGNDEYQSILIKTFARHLILMRYDGDAIFL